MISSCPKLTLCGLILFSMLLACKPMKTENSGIKGTITWVEGNQMPQIVEDGQKPTPSNSRPVQRKIQVYPLMKISDMKMEDGLFVSVMEKAIAEVESDENGLFALALPPGKYSLFTVEENGLFANVFDGEGNAMPITVTENEWTSITIEINYKAVY